jgi:hypothetical protein
MKLYIDDLYIESVGNKNKITIDQIRKNVSKKYSNINISYHLVYNYIRLSHPRFGYQDCQNLVNSLTKKGYDVIATLDRTDNKLIKMIFTSPSMKGFYQVYGDVVLLDSTFKSNIYNFPLVVFSGISHEGRNIIFAIAFINNEQATTYRWVLEKFIKLHDDKRPKAIITDQDGALIKSIDAIFGSSVNHLLCRWHLERNIRSHFAYLSGNREKDRVLKERILNLIYCVKIEHFNQEFSLIRTELAKQKREKSLAYLDRLAALSPKFCQAHLQTIFTANVYTTSRIESINSKIKERLRHRSEFSDVLTFVDEFQVRVIEMHQASQEKKKKFALPSRELDFYLFRKTSLFSYRLIEREIELSNKYQAIRHQDWFEVISVNVSKENQCSKRVEEKDVHFECSCGQFTRNGITCRHIICVFIQYKLSTYEKIPIHTRWLDKDLHSLPLYGRDSVIDPIKRVTLETSSIQSTTLNKKIYGSTNPITLHHIQHDSRYIELLQKSADSKSKST